MNCIATDVSGFVGSNLMDDLNRRGRRGARFPYASGAATGRGIALLLLILSVSMAGCKTGGSARTLAIRMLPDGGCEVAGQVVPASRLDSGLKSAGAGKATRLRVTLPTDVSDAAIRRFAGRLSTAGYRIVHFETPRRAVAYTESE